jgi:hypothetical protein
VAKRENKGMYYLVRLSGFLAAAVGNNHGGLYGCISEVFCGVFVLLLIYPLSSPDIGG